MIVEVHAVQNNRDPIISKVFFVGYYEVKWVNGAILIAQVDEAVVHVK